MKYLPLYFSILLLTFVLIPLQSQAASSASDDEVIELEVTLDDRGPLAQILNVAPGHAAPSDSCQSTNNTYCTYPQNSHCDRVNPPPGTPASTPICYECSSEYVQNGRNTGTRYYATSCCATGISISMCAHSAKIDSQYACRGSHGLLPTTSANGTGEPIANILNELLINHLEEGETYKISIEKRKKN